MNVSRHREGSCGRARRDAADPSNLPTAPLPRLRGTRRAAVALATAMLAAMANAAEPTIDFTVAPSDTLIGLSGTVLVSPAAWREVARLNRLPDPNRIVPGQVLKIPTRLLRGGSVDARLVSASGDVRIGDAPAAAGAALTEGQSVATGEGSSAVVELDDGSQVRLPPSSLAQVAASRRYATRKGSAADAGMVPANARSGWFAGTMRVLRGSVEVVASKVLRIKPLEVVTPTAVIGVRGTRYRVGYEADGAQRTHAEVLEGAVRFDAASAGTDVAGGFGAAADASGAPLQVARLLPAPDLSALPERFDQLLVRFALPGEIDPLRVQVAADDAFERIVSDQRVEAGSEVRIAGLDDARWFVRARRIDTRGLEGFDASRPFVLKARPQPPATLAPRSGAKQTVAPVEFAWARNVEAPQVHLQIAQDDAFTRVLQERRAYDDAALRAELPGPGTYYWRLASVRPNGDTGPFGPPQRFELRPTPEPPSGGPQADGSGLRFQWAGRAQDRQQVQLARDRAFDRVVAQDEVAGPEWRVPAPGGGTYYFRYRSIEPDGFVGPYSETLAVEIPRDWSGLWLLLPLILLL